MKTLLLASIALLLPTSHGLSAQEVPEAPVFQSLEFPEALEAARAQDKLLLVQFFTTWDEYTRRIDKSLWRDPAVREWIAANTIAIRVDHDRAKDLASTYEVLFQSTTLFVGPDDKEELDRIVHLESVEPKMFIQAGDLISKRGTSVLVAREALRADPDNPMLNVHFGDQLLTRGRHREGLTQYLLAWDSRNRSNEDFNDFRRTGLVSRIMQVNTDTLPARKKLELRAIESRRIIDAGVEGAKEIVGADATEEVVFAELGEQAADYAAIQRQVGRPDLPYELFDAVADKPYGQTVQTYLCTFVLPMLGFDKRYEDMLRFIDDPKELAAKAADKFTMQVDAVREQVKKESLWRYRKGFSKDMRDTVSPIFEALVGVGRADEAWVLAEMTLDADSDVETFIDFIEHARRAGSPAIAERIADRAGGKFKEHSKSAKRVQRALTKEL